MKASLPFRDAEGKSDSGGLLWNSGEQGALFLLLALRSRTGLIIPYVFSAIWRLVVKFFAGVQNFAGFQKKDALRNRECLLPD